MEAVKLLFAYSVCFFNIYIGLKKLDKHISYSILLVFNIFLLIFYAEFISPSVYEIDWENKPHISPISTRAMAYQMEKDGFFKTLFLTSGYGK